MSLKRGKAFQRGGKPRAITGTIDGPTAVHAWPVNTGVEEEDDLDRAIF